MDQPRSPDDPSLPRGFRWATTAGVAAVAIAVQLRIFDRKTVPMDEGHLAAAAVRLLDGEILYRDIHTGIGPGIYHVAAALFSIFGEDLVVLRWAQIGVNTTIAILLWLVASRIVRLHWAALPPLAFLLLVAVGFPVLTMLNYSSLALAGALGSLLLLLRYVDSARPIDGIGLGVLLAFTALTKQNFGALAIVAALVIIGWNRPRSPLQSRGPFAAMLPPLASGAAIAACTTIVFAAQGALGDLISSTLIDLGGPQLQAFNNPIPPILGEMPQNDPLFIFLYTPPTLFNHLLQGGSMFDRPITPTLRELSVRLSYGVPLAALLLAPIVLWATRTIRGGRERGAPRAVALFAALFFLGIFPSAIWSHLAFVVPPTLLVLALVCNGLEDLARRRMPVMRWAAVAGAGALGIGCVSAAIGIGGAVRSWYPVDLDLPRASLHVDANMAALYRGSIDFVERCAGPGETLFVAPDIPIVYFLTGRRNPTPYGLTIPGNVDAEKIIESLERSATRCVVYNPRMYPEFPPFATLFPTLDRYLREHYRRDTRISGVGSAWYGLVRNADPTPAPGA